MRIALNDGQLVMTQSGELGTISHRGSTQTYYTYWVMLDTGNIVVVHEDNLMPITQEVYDIAKESV